MTEKITAYKGFDANMQCRGFQFEVGKSYEHNGPVQICKSGFHACEYPLSVFSYYSPAGSRFARVEMSGAIESLSDEFDKNCSARITVNTELTIHELAAAAVNFIAARCEPTNKEHVDGYQSAASSTGKRSAASVTGDRSAASAHGPHGVAMATGSKGCAWAKEGCAIFLVERDNDTGAILATFSGVAGRDGVKSETWYTLKDGKLTEIIP